MSERIWLRIEEVILCETGCGRIAGAHGFCSICMMGIEDRSLERLWNFEAHRRPTRSEAIRTQGKPDMPDWVYRVLGFASLALSGWIVLEIGKMFVGWLANGGRPWQ
jgi:hypothetical protein